MAQSRKDGPTPAWEKDGDPSHSALFAQALCVLMSAGAVWVLHARLRFLKDQASQLDESLLWTTLLVVALPLILGLVLAAAVSSRRGRLAFGLFVPFQSEKDPPPNKLWSQIAPAVRSSWNYERGRVRRGMDRVRLSALLLGSVPTVVLAGLVAFASWDRAGAYGTPLQLQAPRAWPPNVLFAIGVGSALGAAFLLHVAALAVRISSSDINSRMFTWSLQSTLLAAFAAAGLLLVFSGGTTPIVASPAIAALLGLFVAAIGERAIPLLVDKASALFGVKVPVQDEALGLRSLEGMTDEDVERFAEDGVLSVHDLAFASTARLFFSTTRSLPRICDWQDQALLRVYVGPGRAKALADTMAIRGAIDLQGLAQLALEDLFPTTRPEGDAKEGAPKPVAGAAAGPAAAAGTATGAGAGSTAGAVKAPAGGGEEANLCKGIRDALGKALSLEGIPLLAILLTIRHDEAILRLRIHWQSAACVEEEAHGGEVASERQQQAAA